MARLFMRMCLFISPGDLRGANLARIDHFKISHRRDKSPARPTPCAKVGWFHY